MYALWGKAEEFGFLDKTLITLHVAVDVPPGLRIVEGELVRGDADHIAVLLVEIFDGGCEPSIQEIADMSDASGRERFGSGKGAERMEVEVVYR